MFTQPLLSALPTTPPPPVANPTGTRVDPGAIEGFARSLAPDCLLILDQAYWEFAGADPADQALGRWLSSPNVVVLRTFSKAYALAGMRVGWCVADPGVLAALEAVALPFTLTAAAQAAAVASLDHEAALFERVRALIAERQRVREELLRLDFEVPASAANFLWLPLGRGSAQFAQACGEAGVSVRRFGDEGVRVSIGSPPENDAFLEAAARYRSP